MAREQKVSRILNSRAERIGGCPRRSRTISSAALAYDLFPEIPAFELLVVLCTYAVLFRANACYVRGSFLLVLHRFPSVL